MKPLPVFLDFNSRDQVTRTTDGRNRIGTRPDEVMKRTRSAYVLPVVPRPKISFNIFLGQLSRLRKIEAFLDEALKEIISTTSPPAESVKCGKRRAGKWPGSSTPQPTRLLISRQVLFGSTRARKRIMPRENFRIPLSWRYVVVYRGITPIRLLTSILTLVFVSSSFDSFSSMA